MCRMEPYAGRALTEHHSVGRSVFCTESLPAGCAAIQEQPVLYAHRSYKHKTAASILGQLTMAAGIDANDTAIAAAEITKALCFLDAAPAARHVLLAHCDVPAPDQLRNQLAVRVMRAVAACMMPSMRPAATPATTEHELFRALLAMYINAHNFMGGGAVFAWGSKLAHVCGTPNTRFEERDGHGAHVAQRAIHAGEILTTCYINEFRRMCSTRCRQEFLRMNFGFDCACATCTEELDWYRGLPCPSCAAGTLVWHPQQPSSKQWQCTSCKCELTELPQALQQAEDEVEAQVLELMTRAKHGVENLADGVPVSQRQATLQYEVQGPVLQLYQQAACKLGYAHWTTHRVGLILAETHTKLLCQLPPEAAEAALHHLDATQAYTARTWQWLEALPPLPDQAITASSVTAVIPNAATKPTPGRTELICRLLLRLACDILDMISTPGLHAEQVAPVTAVGQHTLTLGSDEPEPGRAVVLLAWLAQKVQPAFKHMNSWACSPALMSDLSRLLAYLKEQRLRTQPC